MENKIRHAGRLFIHHKDEYFINEIKRMGWDVIDRHSLYSGSMQDVADALVGVIEINDSSSIDSIESFIRTHNEIFWIAVIKEALLRRQDVKMLLKSYFYDFHTSPPDYTRLKFIIGHAMGMARLCDFKRQQVSTTATPHKPTELILGNSTCLQLLRSQIQRLSECRLPVLITGESGTGKELVARQLHESSSCSRGPFIPVNCGALPAQLIHSELFGHEKGAFTGASQRKIGKLEAANNGSLLLDEIGDLPLEEQVSLLRFLQEKTIERVGSNQSIQLDVRIIAATHVDLELAVKKDKFRDDLYFRLNVIRLRVPPLRERGDDILLLARHFLDQQLESMSSCPVLAFSEQAEIAMLQHDWPGNVRELLNRVQRASVMTTGRYIQPQDLELGCPGSGKKDDRVCLRVVRETAEREALAKALNETNGKISKMTEKLKVSRATLYRLLDKHSLL
ncbi:sigma-54 dependent transcriptional regulator [Oceanimonas sp. CAM02]|uniref:sigma-54 dependent transcriptional regulator n=1 Tax=Oceanimonas sp. CAM02 TaxID=3080336 RepID=UPI002935AFBF|nr:sigma 54-interacting transcriptional regulator [Oceanimonas sp. CAM02]MDV2857274.1 sigma 54-interacting transcriptional regulator [Oceanimonas sp. CAM02]